jgi:peptidoglycan/LPS O-acetylase OafA/YrhL
MFDSTVSASPTPSPRQRIVSIQVCRGLAAMLVVLCHIGSFEGKYFRTNIMAGFRSYGNIGVDLFFVISGVVISIVSTGRFRNSSNALTFIYHRLARIYPIFWFYFAIVFAAYLYKPSQFSFGHDHHVDLLRSFLLIPYQYDNLLGQAWTLSYEVCFYFVFFLLMLLVSERAAPVFFSLWAGLVVVNMLGPSGLVRSGFLALAVSPLILEFLAGCLLFHIYRRTVLHPRAGKIFIAFAIVWLAIAILWTRAVYGPAVPWLADSSGYRIRAAVFGVFAFFFLFGVMELERSNQMCFARPLEAVGDWSYSIYLSHTLVLSIIGRFIVNKMPAFHFGVLLIDAIGIPFVILTGYLSYTWIERPMTTFFYRFAVTRGLLLHRHT